MPAEDEPPSSSPARWRTWITTSVASYRIDRCLACAAGFGALIAGVVAVVTVLGVRLAGSEALLIPGIPLALGGQFWAIAVLNARMPKAVGGWRLRIRTARKQQRDLRTVFFGALPKHAVYGLTAIFYLAWLAAITAFPALSLGNPTQGTPGCPWALVSHGAVTCVSHARYESAAVAGERLAASVLLGFFTVHFGVLTGELLRRSSATS